MRSNAFIPEQLIHHRTIRLRNEAQRDQPSSSHHTHRLHQTCMDLKRQGVKIFKLQNKNPENMTTINDWTQSTVYIKSQKLFTGCVWAADFSTTLYRHVLYATNRRRLERPQSRGRLLFSMLQAAEAIFNWWSTVDARWMCLSVAKLCSDLPQPPGGCRAPGFSIRLVKDISNEAHRGQQLISCVYVDGTQTSQQEHPLRSRSTWLAFVNTLTLRPQTSYMPTPLLIDKERIWKETSNLTMTIKLTNPHRSNKNDTNKGRK